jgi:hypothetical protein
VLRWSVARRDPDADADPDAWFEAEEPWGRALVVELQRLKRRAAARPILTILLALAMTAFVVVKVMRKPVSHTAYVTMAVSEGSMATNMEPMPVRELQQYVVTALLPDNQLAQLIEEKNLFPLRKRLGMPFAVGELRDLFEVTVYRNYFLQDGYAADLRRTARIELAVTHADDVMAYELAHRLAAMVVDNADRVEDTTAAALQRSADEVTARARGALDALDRRVSEMQVALSKAEMSSDPAVQATIPGRRTEMRAMFAELNYQQEKLKVIEENTRIDLEVAGAMAAGLGLKLEIVAERRPPHEEGHEARLRMLALAIFVLMLPIAGIAIGAFDPRIHDTSDITRLGFTSLGHLPGFAGDRIGSLRARGVRRRRAAQY